MLNIILSYPGMGIPYRTIYSVFQNEVSKYICLYLGHHGGYNNEIRGYMWKNINFHVHMKYFLSIGCSAASFLFLKWRRHCY